VAVPCLLESGDFNLWRQDVAQFVDAGSGVFIGLFVEIYVYRYECGDCRSQAIARAAISGVG